MASSLALWRAAATAAAPSGLLSRLTNPLRAASVAPHAARSLIIGSEMRRYDNDDSEDDEDDSDFEVERHLEVEVEGGSDRPATPRRREPDEFDLLWPNLSLSQLLNQMDQFMGVGAAGWRRGWDVEEDNSVLILRLDMPGLGREDVKVSVEQNTLMIKGEGRKESEEEEEEEESRRRYSSRLTLPPNLYKGKKELEESRRRYSSRLNLLPHLYELGEIKAVMKNGVLKVVVPKVKQGYCKLNQL
ncbi:23.6 kDa heat shock protein, mitochondrial-like [Eucalyptus grandis]|uniref:23.6 kDa heat shock protein, mitochondrial-like n=1 Tax=Eucalyptus grandis TaxID=71139 RepID=UPI00192ECD28|nr:23.6 kDa heat shock protein, mitochondrial-like [Eucalyptus grandis]